MTKKIAYSIANYFLYKNQFDENKLHIYAYGFELIIATIINILGILIISAIRNYLIEAVLFLIAFILLRSTAGGFHTKHHWSCFLTMNIIFYAFSLIVQKIIIFNYIIYYIVFSNLFILLIIWLFSPIRSINNPLTEKQKVIFRKRSMYIVLLNIIISLLYFTFSKLQNNIFLYYFTGSLAASLSLLIIVLQTKIAKNQL